MFEKVNPAHPDKVSDRIAGAMVDLAYRKNNQPKIAVEVLIGHGVCHINTETSVHFFMDEVLAIVERIAGPMEVDYKESAQDVHLAVNQHHKMRCGDNGIFKGTPVTAEQRDLTKTAERIYDKYLCDGKYIITNNHLIICQSNAPKSELRKWFPDAEINPLGDWTGLSRVSFPRKRSENAAQNQRKPSEKVWKFPKSCSILFRLTGGVSVGTEKASEQRNSL